MTREEFLMLQRGDSISHSKDGSPRIYGHVAAVEEDCVYVCWVDFPSHCSRWIHCWDRVIDELRLEIPAVAW